MPQQTGRDWLDWGDIVEVKDFHDAYPSKLGSDIAVGYNQDGDEYFIKEDCDKSYAVSFEITNLAASHVLRQLDINVPAMGYDRDNDRVIIENVGELHDPLRMEDDREQINFDRDSYLDAIAAKLLLGDRDIRSNVLVDDNGTFYPIDFDYSGNDIKDCYSPVHGWANDIGDSIGITVSEDELQERTQELAQQIDTEGLYQDLRSEEPIQQYWETSRIHRLREQYSSDPDSLLANNYLDNVTKAQDGDITPGIISRTIDQYLNHA
jgi:hypothetical protein